MTNTLKDAESDQITLDYKQKSAQTEDGCRSATECSKFSHPNPFRFLIRYKHIIQRPISRQTMSNHHVKATPAQNQCENSICKSCSNNPAKIIIIKQLNKLITTMYKIKPERSCKLRSKSIVHHHNPCHLEHTFTLPPIQSKQDVHHSEFQNIFLFSFLTLKETQPNLTFVYNIKGLICAANPTSQNQSYDPLQLSCKEIRSNALLTVKTQKNSANNNNKLHASHISSNLCCPLLTFMQFTRNRPRTAIFHAAHRCNLIICSKNLSSDFNRTPLQMLYLCKAINLQLARLPSQVMHNYINQSLCTESYSQTDFIATNCIWHDSHS